MLKVFVPYALADNIYEIDPNFFINKGVEILICDLDNTLDSFDNPNPSEEAIELVRKFKSYGLRVIVISNNTKKRVSKYCSILGCDYIHSARKPLKYKTKGFFKDNEIDFNKCMYIGDQVFTDIVYANRFKIRSILCSNLVDKDLFITKFNKFLDRHFRKAYKKKNLVKDWKEL